MSVSFRGRALRASVLALLGAFFSTGALAHRPLPLKPGQNHFGPKFVPLRVPPPTSGTWTALANSFPGLPTRGVDTSLLMTDGTVLTHEVCTGNWYRLTPDQSGSYVNGTWHAAASLPGGYAPLYFASAVLHDGRLLINGGEYNNCNPGFVMNGALYDPVADTWTDVPPPGGWSGGDAASAALWNGTYMLQDVLSSNIFIGAISGNAVTWHATGTGKADVNDEEGWTLLPDGNVFTVDTARDHDANTPAEIYNVRTHVWSSVATAPSILVDPASYEIGPAVRLGNGTVFQAGAAPCGTTGCAAHTAIYNPSNNTWTSGPDIPSISSTAYAIADGPAAFLPTGHILIQASPSYVCGSAFCSPSHFFEYNFGNNKLVQVNDPTGGNVAAYEGRMLVLPTGQILWTSDQGATEIYTAVGVTKTSVAPLVSSGPSTVTRGSANNSMSGARFIGVSNGASYGDDAQMNSNYPLVRITNLTSGHICYARTHNYSASSLQFDVPSAVPPAWEQPCETGASNLEVVVNGIPSTAQSITVN